MQDHYAILGVPRNANQELIKATYKALLKIYHPDVFKGDKKFATEQLKKINIAFEILSDPKKRKNYDAHYKENSDKKKNTEDFPMRVLEMKGQLIKKLLLRNGTMLWDFTPSKKGNMSHSRR